MEYVQLNNGIKMPMLGYGVYQVTKNECERCVTDALSVGYRLIDTAQSYFNEEEVGAAITKSGIPREEIFLTTKVWVEHYGYEECKKSVYTSLEKLKTDYLDLMLLHQPFSDYYGAYRALEELYNEGVLRAIGVSNFYPDRLVDIASFANIVPMVNQVETHVLNQQKVAKEYMDKYGVQCEAWAPFGEGRGGLFENETLINIGKKYGKTSAQVMLRWNIQRGVVVLPDRQSGGGRRGALLAAHHALEGGAQGHFGLAHAHVAAQQAVHGITLFHVLLDLGGGVQLVVGLVVVKAGLKVPLPVAVRREGIARGLTAASVELDQFLRHLLGGFFYLGAGALPLSTAQLCQLYLFLVAGGGVAAQQVQLGHRYIQHVRAGVLHLQVIFRGTLHFQPLDARIHADAVALVHHIVPGLDVRKAGKGVLVLFALLGLGGGLFLQTVPAAGQHCRMGKRKGAPGG